MARRWLLWGALVLLVSALLVTLVWLARRYEAGRLQERIELDAVDVAGDIRSRLARSVQNLQGLPALDKDPPQAWSSRAVSLLLSHRELLRIELRDADLQLVAHADSEARAAVFDPQDRVDLPKPVAQACRTARATSGPWYSSNRPVITSSGHSLEVLELCLPFGRRADAFLVATYALNDILTEMVDVPFARAYDVSFSEVDGKRVAFHGVARSGNRTFSAQQVLELPGHALVLRLDSWRGTPALFPNFLTAMVVAMAIGLVFVLVLLAHDTRRRMRAEHELADALAFRKAMEDSLVTGLQARDLEGRTTYANPAFCQMVGFSVLELMHAGTDRPYWPSEQFDEYREQLARLAGSAPPREGLESVFMRKDGSLFPVLIIETPLINAHGMHNGWMTALLDISEQRRVEEVSRASRERLQATARLAIIGEMASMLSHELNQPLAAITSYAIGSINMLDNARQASCGVPALAGGSNADDEPASALPLQAAQTLDEGLRHIADQAQRAGKIIKSVYDFVRRRDRAHEVIGAQMVLDAILPLVQLQARKLGVRIQIRIDEGLPPIRCDRTMVEQVVLNLARNAMQAMDGAEEQTRLLVLQVRRAPSSERTAHATGWLEFSVADTGTGIAPEIQEKLFTPFFTTKAEGMGLGLSLCRTVVEQHGGFLAYGPNMPCGTVFRFTLPVAPRTPSAQA